MYSQHNCYPPLERLECEVLNSLFFLLIVYILETIRFYRIARRVRSDETSVIKDSDGMSGSGAGYFHKVGVVWSGWMYDERLICIRVSHDIFEFMIDDKI